MVLHYNLFYFKYGSYENCSSRLKEDAKEEILVGALEQLVNLLAQEAPAGEGTMYTNNLLRCAVS